ncbi:hypothetical protein DXC27_09610 [Ruminococcus sp. OM08-7]|nr:hypothetical protein DXC27_09610 [Ruminococcus sp. OM08-7]
MRALKENTDGRYQKVPTACGKVNVSRNTLMKIAGEANAVVRFGKSVRIDMPVLYDYINQNCKN